MVWKRIVQDDKMRKRITERIEGIADSLSKNKAYDSGLLGGEAGLSLYWKYLSIHSKDASHEDNFKNSVGLLTNAISNEPMDYTFCAGVSGILWTFAHLVNNNMLNDSFKKNIGEEIDEFLFESSIKDLQLGRNDYMHEGVGPILYFLERAENEFCRKSISKIIQEIHKTAHRFPEGFAWVEAGFLQVYDSKKYNLGLAHGIPSIIVLLTKVLQTRIDAEEVKKLLDGTINWLLDKKNVEGKNGLFPTTIPTEIPYTSRVGWCYGDLGISIALIQAAIATNNDDLKKESIKIGLNAAKRTHGYTGVRDVCLCHGASGNAHIFNRLYNYTGEQEFKEASLFWLNETLDFYERNGHFKNLVHFKKNGKKGVFKHKNGLLEGIAGVGLIFLASINDIEPKWDRSILLS